MNGNFFTFFRIFFNELGHVSPGKNAVPFCIGFHFSVIRSKGFVCCQTETSNFAAVVKLCDFCLRSDVPNECDVISYCCHVFVDLKDLTDLTDLTYLKDLDDLRDLKDLKDLSDLKNLKDLKDLKDLDL